jgi:NAD(P)-dependent dehydrogenase (short-subunit alcohol dehydrogenase family)
LEKLAIVTGAARGMGRGITLRLLGEGYSVVAIDVDQDALNQLEEEAGSKLIKRPGDIGDSNFIKELVNELDSDSLELLVNNAGIRFSRSILEESDEEWDTTLRVNLSGPFFLMREVGRAMANAGHGGLIINIASVAGLVGLNNRASYCASKGGLVLLTKAAAMDLAPEGVRVVAICPGFVNTTMTLDDAAGLLEQHVPLAKSGSPDDIAQAVVDLTHWNIASGSTIVLDGGLTAGFKW